MIAPLFSSDNLFLSASLGSERFGLPMPFRQKRHYVITGSSLLVLSLIVWGPLLARPEGPLLSPRTGHFWPVLKSAGFRQWPDDDDKSQAPPWE
jgi:hypothetical protein